MKSLTKTNKFLMSLLLASSLIPVVATAIQAQTPLVIGQNNSNAVVINGVSGGSDNHRGCGYLSTMPNQMISLQEETNFMSLSVSVDSPQGSPTLLIIGKNTNTQFCAFQDQTTGEAPQISGLLPKDVYSIYVGDRNGGNYNFTLSINSSNDLNGI
jgi:hypothetical protein